MNLEAGNKIQFRVLLILVFILEAAGYLAIPYLALHLREAFYITEVKIGLYFMVGIWLRPVWALSASALAKKIPTGRLIQFGALVSGLAISGLALSRNPIIAFLAVIFANFGLSIWSPSTYAYTYDLFGSGEDSKKQISRLNFSIYTGAAVGSGIAALLANSQRDLIFLASTCAFLAAFLFGSVLTKKTVQKTNEVPTDKNDPPFSIRQLANTQVIFLSLATAGYWASYAQFNSFFSLFAVDWLKQPEIVGAAFSFLTIGVAVFSLGISHSKHLQKHDSKILIGILFVIGILWFLMLSQPNIWTTWTFIAALGLSEAFFVLVIAHLWAKQSEHKSHFMQSLNYSLCNIGMGGGALLGGYLYKAPDSGSLTGFASENLILCWIAFIGMAIIVFWLNKKATKND